MNLPLLAAVFLVGGCKHDLEDVDGIFYNGDGRKVHCAAGLDDRSGNPVFSIDTALDRAAAEGVVAEFFTHNPGKSIPVEKLEYVLAGARDRGLTFYTYADFVAGVPIGPGIALAFDDHFTQAWTDTRPLLQTYGARVTFYVSRYSAMAEDQHAQIRQLRNDGHDVAAHSVLHLNAPSYVQDHGLAAYMDDEMLPSLDALRADGFEVTSFAYPFGARTSELDNAILEHLPLIRSVTFGLEGVVQSPCPN